MAIRGLSAEWVRKTRASARAQPRARFQVLSSARAEARRAVPCGRGEGVVPHLLRGGPFCGGGQVGQLGRRAGGDEVGGQGAPGRAYQVVAAEPADHVVPAVGRHRDVGPGMSLTSTGRSQVCVVTVVTGLLTTWWKPTAEEGLDHD
ncbi:hypothetical protein HY68_07700 [Streptomyces sp. AcH 505]|nr:hypothetical protein HY68_07700 [Streptomyces sp. AcH 505]